MAERLKVIVDQDHWGKGTLVMRREGAPSCYCIQGFIGKALGLTDEQMGLRPSKREYFSVGKPTLELIELDANEASLAAHFVERAKGSTSALYQAAAANDRFGSDPGRDLAFQTIKGLKLFLTESLHSEGIDLEFIGDPNGGPMYGRARVGQRSDV